MGEYIKDYVLECHLHARPSSMLYQSFMEYQKTYEGIKLYVKNGDEEVQAQVMSLLTLGAPKGTKISLRLEGDFPRKSLEEVVNGLIGVLHNVAEQDIHPSG